MKRFLATLAIPVAALGTLGFAACGDDDDEPDATVSDTETTVDTETTDTGVTGDTTETGDTAITLPDISLPDISVPGGTLPGGITLPDISLPDISLPDVSVPDVSEILSDAFPNLTDEQVDCLADALGDVSDIDVSQIMEQIGQCDIDLADLTGGG